MTKPQCIPKRKLYLSQTYSSTVIPRRTRVYNRLLSLLGFIFETPCSERNRDRYLIAYDNFSAGYHFSTDFHLCLCQDFSQHMTNLDSDDIQVHYQHAFRRIHQNVENHFSIGQTIPVRKYGVQYHNARVVDQDCALIKVCFFERKSQPEMWIHCQSSIIQSSFLSSLSQLLISSTFPVNNSTDDNSAIHSDASCSHKRSRHLNNENEGMHRKARVAKETVKDTIHSQSNTFFSKESSHLFFLSIDINSRFDLICFKDKRQSYYFNCLFMFQVENDYVIVPIPNGYSSKNHLPLLYLHVHLLAVMKHRHHHVLTCSMHIILLFFYPSFVSSIVYHIQRINVATSVLNTQKKSIILIRSISIHFSFHFNVDGRLSMVNHGVIERLVDVFCIHQKISNDICIKLNRNCR